MNQKKIMKGGIGYIDQCKKNQLVKVICWAVIIAAVVGGGWLYFKTRLNMVTILGVLLVLPAAKALIALILILPYQSGDADRFNKVKETAGKAATVLSDLVLTRYEGSMAIHYAVIHGGNIFAFVPSQKTAPEKIQAYLTASVKAGGSSGVPMVFTDFEKFMTALKRVGQSPVETSKKDERIIADLLSRAV